MVLPGDDGAVARCKHAHQGAPGASLVSPSFCRVSSNRVLTCRGICLINVPADLLTLKCIATGWQSRTVCHLESGIQRFEKERWLGKTKDSNNGKHRTHPYGHLIIRRSLHGSKNSGACLDSTRMQKCYGWIIWNMQVRKPSFSSDLQ